MPRDMTNYVIGLQYDAGKNFFTIFIIMLKLWQKIPTSFRPHFCQVHEWIPGGGDEEDAPPVAPKQCAKA